MSALNHCSEIFFCKYALLFEVFDIFHNSDVIQKISIEWMLIIHVTKIMTPVLFYLKKVKFGPDQCGLVG